MQIFHEESPKMPIKTPNNKYKKTNQNKKKKTQNRPSEIRLSGVPPIMPINPTPKKQKK